MNVCNDLAKAMKALDGKNDDPNELRGRMQVGKPEMHKGSWDITVRITFASSAEMLGTLWKNSLKAFFPAEVLV